MGSVEIPPQCSNVLFDKRKLLGRLLAIRECFNTSYGDVAPMALEADKRIIRSWTSSCFVKVDVNISLVFIEINKN
jgi:hypothetical protein